MDNKDNTENAWLIELFSPPSFSSELQTGIRADNREQRSGARGSLNPMPSLLVVFLWIALFLINGCATGTTIHKWPIGASNDLTPPASVFGARVGIFYDPTYPKYVHRQSFSDSLATADVGRESVNLFNVAVSMTFEEFRLVFDMPPFVQPPSVDGFVEPRLDYVNWRMLFDKEQEFFHVGYKFIFYTADGVPISTWSIDGEGKYLKHQLTDAAQKFVSGFHTAPETVAFREYLASKEVGELAFNVDDIEIDAHVVEENPLGLNLKAVGIIPIQVTIKNGTNRDVKSSGLFARLTYWDFKRLIPAFPLAIVSEFEYLAAINADDPATAGMFFGTLGLIGSMTGSHSKRVDMRKKQTDYFENARLKGVTLKSGDSVKGMLYFILPEVVTDLNNAKLSLWFVDTDAANGAMKNVELIDIGYTQPNSLQ